MAQVRLVDIYNPLTFSARAQEAQIELNKFIASGVMVSDPALATQISAGGNLGEITNYNPLGTDEPNYSDDVAGNLSTPDKVDSATMTFRLTNQNNSWSTMDLARDLALEDPVQAITNRIGQYWATQNERRLINSAMGLLADNIANDAGDMVVTVGTDDAAAITDAERISADVVIDAKQTMGDHKDALAAIAMHSAIFARLEKQNLISFIPNARGEIGFPRYLGMVVVVDDSLPAVAGSNRILYTCILFGPGTFGSAMGRTTTPSELDRTPAAGNGGGQETLFSRRSDLIHPLGFSFLSGSIAGQSATQAELLLAANWNRVWDRKHADIAYLQVNE